jgi:hypothetical protein
MYCDIDTAYNTPSDLTQSRNDCVYDNIINDKSEEIKKYHPENIFTAQGEYKPYQELEKTYGTSLVVNQPMNRENGENEGTLITDIRPESLPIVPSTPNHILTHADENQIRNIVNDSFYHAFEKSKKIPQKKIINTKHVIPSEVRDGIILTFIGILLLFLLDLLIRISRKL